MSSSIRVEPQNESTGDRPSWSTQKDAARMQGFDKNKSSSGIVKREETEIDCPDVWSVAFLADGEHFVGNDRGRIRRWRVQDGKEVGTPMNMGSTVRSISVAQDGRWIVTGSDKGDMTVWNTAESVTVIQGHRHLVRAVDVSSDGTKITSGSDDCTASVWSLSTGKRLLGPFKHDHFVVAVKFSPDSRLITTATWDSLSVRVYDGQNGHLLVDFPITVSSSLNHSLAWSSDKQLLALSKDGNVHCFDVYSRTTLSQWPVHDAKYHCCLSLANNGVFIAVSDDSSVSFWDITTHKQIGSVIRYPDTVYSMAISANYDLVTAGGSKIVSRDLLDILPFSYHGEIFDIRRRWPEARVKEAFESFYAQYARPSTSISTLTPKLKVIIEQLRTQLTHHECTAEERDGMIEAIMSLCAETADSNEKIANLEESVQELRHKFAHSQHEADGLVKQLRTELADSQRKADTLLCAYRRKHHCETLYADGRVIDAAQTLLEIERAANEDVKTDTLIMDWLFGFASKCIVKLEKFGDEVSQINNHDEAFAAYSSALSLGPSIPNDLLNKWASSSLLRGLTNNALDVATKFKVPRFRIYSTLCDILEGNCCIPEEIGYFRRMQCELASDASISNEQARWQLGFQRRCTQKLHQLSDVAMGSRNYKEAVEHLSAILLLDPSDRVDTLIKRSSAQMIMGSWEDALIDADEVIQLDPSSYRGYEQKYAALHGAKRCPEAVEAFDTMLSKLDQSPDEHVRELRGVYIDARPEIRRAINATVSQVPRVLIDTTTGLLHDRMQLAGEFEGHPIFPELVLSMTRVINGARVWEEVKKFYRYAMLSHKWEQDEPLLQDVEHISVYELKSSCANVKLQTFCSTARSHGLRWAWSDTCCVDKVNNVVLQESLVAMFSWYCGSALTIIYLLDVLSNSNKVDLKRSIWNTRAWTYQEYMAAERVVFYTADWQPYLGLTLSNHKESPIIVSEMQQVSRVSQEQLAVLRPGLNRVREKLFLASTCQSTLVEDMAYSLLGIFNVTIPVIYGEQHRAIGRFLEHILTGSRDVTVLAWTGTANTYNSCLPTDLAVYNQLEPPHIPQPMKVTQVDQRVTDLRSSIPDLSLVMQLYDQISALPPPFLVSTRLELAGIVILVDEVVRVSEPDPTTKICVYRATTTVFGDVEIQTTNDLTAMGDLHLVHPWIRPLLDQEFSRGRGRGARHDRTTRALRLIARLMQPFGALLFEQVSRVDYRQVAADSLIMAQVRKDVSLDDLIQNIDKVEVQ